MAQAKGGDGVHRINNIGEPGLLAVNKVSLLQTRGQRLMWLPVGRKEKKKNRKNYILKDHPSNHPSNQGMQNNSRVKGRERVWFPVNQIREKECETSLRETYLVCSR